MWRKTGRNGVVLLLESLRSSLTVVKLALDAQFAFGVHDNDGDVDCRKEKGRVEFEKELPRRSYIYLSALRYKLNFSGGRDPLCARRECIAERTSIVKSLDLVGSGASM